MLTVAMFPFLLYIFLVPLNAEYTQIEDIPIENFHPLSHQENDMDLELLPRLQRSSPEDDDPKANFFRYMKSLNAQFENNEPLSINRYDNLPRPGGFSEYFDVKPKDIARSKRDVKEEEKSKEPASLSEEIVKHLGKPLELAILETETETDSSNIKIETTTKAKQEESNLLINDFIRFRRQTGGDLKSRDVEHLTEASKSVEPNADIEVTSENGRLKREHKHDEQSQKLQYENSREPRGATKEQWVKHPYPIQRSADTRYEDNSPASSETVRAPRVHFVTQRRLESTVPRSYEREARAKDLNREVSRDLSRDLNRDMDYFQPRVSRHYDPPPQHRYRDEPYYNSRYDRAYDRYDSRYDNFDRERAVKPKRIIYWATLPDISRTPPNVDLRDRYNYDRYDDRHNFPVTDPYYTRKVYPKSRYENLESPKDHYPLKVSTDVSVREIKKNPERRIYTDVDRNRYAYKASPYQDRN